MATVESSAAPKIRTRRRAFTRRAGHELRLAQAALAARHCAHRGISAGAPALELRGAQRPARLRRPGEVPQQPAAGARAGVGLHLPAHPLSRLLRSMDLAARQVEHCLLPMGRELDVYPPALHGPRGVRVHRAARLAAALHGRHAPREPLLRVPQGADGACEPLDAGRLYCRHDLRLLALCLRRVALRGQVGHYIGRKRAPPVWVRLRCARRAACRHGAGQYFCVCGSLVRQCTRSQALAFAPE